MKRVILVCCGLIVCAATVTAQKDKPWTEWSQQEAQKMLSDSPWAQTQKELTESASGSGGPTITSAAQNGNGANMVMSDAAKNASESGQNVGRQNASLTLDYRVAFLTAKPVREAFIRMVELQKPDTPAQTVAERRTFIDRDFGDYVVVTLTVGGTDRKKQAPVMQLLTSADAASLKTTTYLERKDGKRVALMDYRAPGLDGMGAKFIFPRTLDGQPFLDNNSGEVRVYLEVGKTKVSRRFKVSEMMYQGKLEY